MTRLGVLYPPCGAEFEYYHYGEKLGAAVRVALVGVRIHGGDDEHGLEHLSRTGALDNLRLSARVMQPLRPDAAVWACTSGSFVDGLDHARAQTRALGQVLGCPATSTSLAFGAALEHLAIDTVSVLASYPERTASAFFSFLSECGITVHAYRCLDLDCGPAAAGLRRDSVAAACAELPIPEGAALLIPDTAIPAMHWVEPLERALDRPVLTANQVSLWHTARLAGIGVPCLLPGRLIAA